LEREQSIWSKGSAVSTSENKNSKKESLLAVLAVTSEPKEN